MSPVQVRLKPGREKPVLHGHPWIFSGAVEKVSEGAKSGDVADVLSFDGNWLARGLVNPDAALMVRIYTRDAKQAIDEALIAGRVARAVAFREPLFKSGPETNAYRLVFSEADALPGFVVDRYADVLAVQVGARAVLPLLDTVLKCLREKTGLTRISVRAEDDAVEREKLDVSALPEPWPEDAPPVRIRESGYQFDVDLGRGQKTGFFLDQRVNRQRVAAFASGRRVLSAYCYTGGFEVYAAAAGAAQIIGLDRSEGALKRAAENHKLNGTTIPCDYRRADVGDALRRFRDAGETFDLIILDPPRFVSSRAQMEKGLRAYKDINLLAMKLLTPGGVLATFSCSGQVGMAEFRTMVGWASVDAGRAVRIVEALGQPADHPVLAVFPESEYLKGLICVVE